MTAGTIFQDTRRPLSLWFRAMWCVASQKTGTSARTLQRVLGLGSYQTAWSWLHKLRRAMVRPGRERPAGRVEVDETFIGALEDGVRGRGAVKKALIVVAARREGPEPESSSSPLECGVVDCQLKRRKDLHRCSNTGRFERGAFVIHRGNASVACACRAGLMSARKRARLRYDPAIRGDT